MATHARDMYNQKLKFSRKDNPVECENIYFLTGREF
jgi:hypothetical protein